MQVLILVIFPLETWTIEVELILLNNLLQVFFEINLLVNLYLVELSNRFIHRKIN